MRVGWVAIVGLLLGCPHRTSVEEDPLERLLREADAAWASRGESGLEPVGVALREAWLLGSADPRVLWRLARLEVARGLVSDSDAEARRHYARARAHGIRCLDQVPGVRDARQVGAWGDALARASTAREPCATWGALGWARWRVVLGEAGAVDDDDLLALTRALTPDPQGVALWAHGLVLAATGDAEAGVWLGRAAAADPGDLVRRADRLVVGRVDDPDGWSWLLRQTPDTPEERAVLARLRGERPAGP